MPSGGKHAQMRGFTPEEDGFLHRLVATEGPRWKAIAEAMTAQAPDAPRTAAMVRNRFLRVQKGKKEAEEGKARNKCGLCGQLKKGHVCTADKALIAAAADDEATEGCDSTPATASKEHNLPPIAESRLDAIEQDENSFTNTTSSTLQLFAPPIGLITGSDRTAVAEYAAAAAAELQLAAACWSPQTSPGGGVEPSPDITMASLLAPTPEGMVYSFPTLPASLQAALSGAQRSTAA